MSLPRLTYFNTDGRGFAIRAALRHAKVEYSDVRVSFKELVEARGPSGFSDKVPLGSLPVLELPDGRVIAQSASIARWAGRIAKLWPEDPLDALVCDSAMETANEFASNMPQHADPAEKKRLREEFAAKHFDKYMRALQANIKGPFILGDALTVADMYVQNVVNMVATGNADYISPDLLKAYPKLLAFRDAVRAHPIAKAELDATAARAKA